VRYAIGVDIGGTNIKCVAVDDDGAVRVQRCEPTGDEAGDWARIVPELVASIEADFGAAAEVGVASPGLAARDGRTIAWMQGRMAGVQGFDWSMHLARARPVPVLNDAHAALLGEAWLGAAIGARDVVMLTLGTGIGGAALVNGRLLRGTQGRAGHVGHITVDADGARDIVGMPGSLEDAMGDCTLAARSGGRFTTTAQLVAAYRDGDPDATSVWLRSIRRLAVAIASLVNVLDPELIVLGGGISGAADALFDPLAAQLDDIEWRPLGRPARIVPAVLGPYAGALGAARHALFPVTE